MAQIDDLSAALAKATTDTQKFIADVASQVQSLKDQIATLQGQVGQTVDLSGMIDTANALDKLSTDADAAIAPTAAPTPSA